MLLLLCFGASLVLIIRMQITQTTATAMVLPLGAAVNQPGAVQPPQSTVSQQPAAVVPASFPAPQLQNLVLVAGHAVYTGIDFHLAAQEQSWFLEAYQQASPPQHAQAPLPRAI